MVTMVLHNRGVRSVRTEEVLPTTDKITPNPASGLCGQRFGGGRVVLLCAIGELEVL